MQDGPFWLPKITDHWQLHTMNLLLERMLGLLGAIASPDVARRALPMVKGSTHRLNRSTV